MRSDYENMWQELKKGLISAQQRDVIDRGFIDYASSDPSAECYRWFCKGQSGQLTAIQTLIENIEFWDEIVEDELDGE